MKSFILLLLLSLSPIAAQAMCICTQSTIADDVARSSAVIEGTVDSVDRESGKAHLRVTRTWKTDGGDLTVVYSGLSECDFPLLRLGRSYILFTERSQTFWSFLPWVDEPLWVSWCSESVPLEPEEFVDYYRKKIALVRQHLDGAKP